MAFGSLASGRIERPISDINVIPLVDVMLVLLIIFMVTAPLLTHAVKVDLPRAAAGPNVTRAERIELALKIDGSAYWNGAALDTGQLRQRLRQAGRRSPAPELHLAADREVPYGRVAEIMSAAARAGLTRLRFVTDPAGASE
ncbi:MAG: biopolymer transporter ExbD [Pseudomonadota bacterium]|jgi:biopolymer transport protein ExbD